MIARRFDPAREAARQALIARVCAVHVFDPAQLPGVDGAADLLARDADKVALPDGTTGLSLRTDVRIDALAKHASAQSVLAAAASIPARIMTPTQRAFERWIGAHELAPDVPAEDLARVMYWLEHVDWARTDAQSMQGELWRRERYAELQQLGGAHFVGRVDELALLHSLLARPADAGLAWLLIDAVGGMGKTALLARFQLDIADSGSADLVVHVDFDDSAVDIRTPATVLAPIASAIASRVAELHATADELASIRGGDILQANAESVATAESRFARAMAEVHRGLASAIAAAQIRHLVIILDTIEKPWRQSADMVAAMLAYLHAMAADTSTLVIVAGRGAQALKPLLTDAVRELPLHALSLGDARELLRRQGIADDALAARLLDVVPHRPLTLRLAARAGAAMLGALDDAAVRAAVSRQLVDGYLHLRILDHLGDPRVAALVHPGFVLRRLTQATVLGLLADVPIPPVDGPDDADALLQGVRRVNDLVIDADDRSGLALRAELRGELLQLMREDDREGVAQLHRKAFGYFTKRKERAEAAYHLLALDEDDPELALLGLDEAALHSLAESSAELPARAAAAIAARLDEGGSEKRHDETKLGVPLRGGGTGSGRGTGHFTHAKPPDRGAPPAAPPQPIPPSDLVPDAVTSPMDPIELAQRVSLLLSTGRLDDADALVAQYPALRGDELLSITAQLRWLQGRDADVLAVVASAEPIAPTSTAHLALLVNAARAHARISAPAAAATAVARAVQAIDAFPNLSPLEGLKGWAMIPAAAADAPTLALIRAHAAACFDALPDAALREDRAMLRGAGALFTDGKRLQRTLLLGALDDLRDVTRPQLLAAMFAPYAQLAQLAPGMLASYMVPSAPTAPVVASLLQGLAVATVAPDVCAEAVRCALAEEHRAATAFAPGRAAERAAALDDLAAWIGAHTDAARRMDLARTGDANALTYQKTQGSPDDLVRAFDRDGLLIALLNRLLSATSDAAELRDLLALRRRIARPPAHEHVPHAQLLDEWHALAADPDVQAAATSLAIDWGIAWATEPNISPQRRLADAMELLNLRAEPPPPGALGTA